MSEAVRQALDSRAHSELWARLASETGLARAALVLVGLHVVDDRFLQPEPGLAARDHLVSGLVPLAPSETTAANASE